MRENIFFEARNSLGDEQTGRGVASQDVDQTVFDAALSDDSINLGSYVDGLFRLAGLNLYLFKLDDHDVFPLCTFPCRRSGSRATRSSLLRRSLTAGFRFNRFRRAE